MKHPEQRPDEIYLGNARPGDLSDSSWKTSRLGKVGLQADGSPLGKHNAERLRPWFIKRAEVEATIQAERLNNKPWSASTIRVYEAMLAEGGEA